MKDKKKTRKLAIDNKIGRKLLTQQRNENAKAIFEIRVDMTNIKYNFWNETKCCSLCRKSETAKVSFSLERK